MAKYWFQPKSYGYGFYPISWEGWLATLVLLIMILLSGWANGIFSEIGATAEGGVRFILDVFL
ncbi:MAG: hypothetical protein QF442_03020, partial [Candidatus Peribacteraceae bacterium]|nr:hypothetical protein [Candidatus Peribacteraceae bacterium]